MRDRSCLRRAIRRALFSAGALAAAGFSNGVLAQEAPSAGASATEEVIVTGSRLRRDRDFVAVSPVQTIDLQQIQSSGNATLAELVNEYPQLVPDNTSVSNQSGGTGVLAANLRALGAVRTLVLVDGRRFIPANETGLTDLATIPDALVERVEIVTGGASAVYGSDAIAGAVNFILRDDFEGAEFTYQYGETSRGDGANHKLDLLLGANVADGRGNVTLHGSYTEREAIFFTDRDFSAVSLLADGNGVLQQLKLPTIPGGHINIPAPSFNQIQGVDLIAAQATCPGPVEGLRFGAGSVPAAFCRPLDGYDFPALNYLQRPLQRWQITSLGDFKLHDRVEVHAQMTYTNKENAYQQAPDSVRPTSPGQETGTLLIPNADTNPLFTPVLQDFFAANTGFFDPDGDGIFRVRSIAYRAEQLGPRTVTTRADSYSLAGGFRGDFDLGSDNTWSWDSFYQYARSNVDFIQENRLSQTRVALGLDPVFNSQGQLVCRAGGVLGCVPVSIFGTDALTPAMIDFLSVTAAREDVFTRKMAGASLAGNLFDLPAGPLGTALGIEWRKEQYSTNPNEVLTSGEVGSRPFPVPVSGEYDISEVFAEVRVPILRDLPAVESLAVELAARFSDYSTVGSVTTWKSSLDWQVTESFRVRGGISTAIRAPNLNELFAPQSLGFDGGASDPCWQISNPTPEEKQLCIAQGVPPELVDTLPQLEPGFISQRGGNPNLTEEEADTYTVGVVFSPTPQFSVALDYFDIEITDAVTPITGQLVVQTCFASLDINSTECRAISRRSNGQIDVVVASLLNVATRAARGLDLSANYGVDLPGFLALPSNEATLQLSMVATKQFEQATQVVTTLPTLECAGYYGGSCSSDGVRITPELSALLRASWNSGPAEVSAQFNYIGELELHPNSTPLQVDSIGARVYVDLNLGLRVGEGVRLYGGVKNLLDKDPPIIGLEAGGDSNTNVETFDPLGRRYFLGASIAF